MSLDGSELGRGSNNEEETTGVSTLDKMVGCVRNIFASDSFSRLLVGSRNTQTSLILFCTKAENIFPRVVVVALV